MTQLSTDPRPWRATGPLVIGIIALVLLVAGVGFWSALAHISGAVIAPGVVRVEINRQVVQHPQGGVIGSIFAHDGDLVRAGDVLVTLDDTFLRSELAAIDGQLAEMEARQAQFRAERDGDSEVAFSDALIAAAQTNEVIHRLLVGQQRLFQTRASALQQEQDQLSEQIAQSRNQIVGIEAQLRAVRAQISFARQDLEAQQILFERGFTVAPNVTALSREQAKLEGEQGQLEAAIAQLRGQIAGFEIQSLRLLSARQEEAVTALRELEFQEIDLIQRRRAALETLARTEIRAPASGIVYDSQVFSVQSVISAAQPIMHIIPQDQPLVIIARVDTIHIDQVRIGQDVTMRFSTFDQRETPEIFGRVLRISADAFTHEASGFSYYQVELAPNDGELAKLHGQPLIPGMPVESYIRTAERTPLSFLMKPLTDYFFNAFREP